MSNKKFKGKREKREGKKEKKFLWCLIVITNATSTGRQ
jgi:hypothetical protein